MQLEQYFLYPKGVYALLALIPLIILYLIRPKPKDKVVPSLMFLVRKDKKKNKNSFLQKLINNLLFIIQLLIIMVIAVSMAKPYVMRDYETSAEKTVLVIDVSASIAATYDGQTRLEREIGIAKNKLGRKNTIILAANIPELYLEEASVSESLDALEKVKSKDTTTNLGDALMFASNHLTPDKGKIILISDFAGSETDPEVVKKVLESKGFKIDFLQVTDPAENVGIIDLIVGKQDSVAYVKNYGKDAAIVKMKIGGAESELEISAKSIEAFAFKTPPGTSELSLTSNDGFDLDDKSYISIPTRTKNRILRITNKGFTNVHYALISNPKNEVEVANPPLVSRLDYDVFVIDKFDVKLLLPETIKKIKTLVSEGRSIIIVYQKDIFDAQFNGLLPVTNKGTISKKSQLKVDYMSDFTTDVDFGSVSNIFNVDLNKEAVSVVSTVDGNPVIAYHTVGQGIVFYYGINDLESDFKASAFYPLFWNNILDFLIKKDDITNLNIRTGQSYGEKSFDTVGIKTLNEKKIAVNLLSESESDIGRGAADSELAKGMKGAGEITKMPHRTDIWLLGGALALLFVELYYIKYRGDL